MLWQRGAAAKGAAGLVHNSCADIPGRMEPHGVMNDALR